MSEILLPDAAAWRAWLDENEDVHDGGWVVLAKKGTREPTSLTYAEALEEALCSGWIDGQKRGRDETTFLQRFTPRRKASLWSQRNVTLVAVLLEQGRMRPRGQTEIDRAQADGRWDRAYAGAAAIAVPADLAAALADSPAATVAFAAASRTNRYAILHRIATATPAARAGRVARLVDGLARGEYPYPQ
ncbi:MAG: YdeI/OmpD-associated family protein [Microbacterium sp.]|uniref:YdeI/OmpD-associated family protein n=1 Tax=Microbacterium sp. TaxID=51671 RepID=UPI0039E42920